MEVNPQLWEQVKTEMKHKMEPKVVLNNSVCRLSTTQVHISRNFSAKENQILGETCSGLCICGVKFLNVAAHSVLWPVWETLFVTSDNLIIIWEKSLIAYV